MDKTLCEQFDTLRKYIPDELNISTSNDIHKLGNAKNYCPNGGSGGTECKNDFDKIKAGCLWLFEQLFVENNKNTNTVQYIIIWLSYKLNQKTYDEIKDLNDFYTKCIKDNTHYNSCKQGDADCSKKLDENTGYTNYKKIIDGKKNLLSTNIKNMSKIYDAFKLLCNAYTELNADNTISNKSLENAKKFFEKYNELNTSDIDENSPYYQVLSTLSSDYNNFKSYCDRNNNSCSNIPSLTPTETEESDMQSSKEICVVTSPSFSICSLFILRKRAQKEYLREKLKK
ncbi:YIR protein [Plasmodium yoelii]|uniref:YIR protein n=1 Tax=Plasmodium yoelii TaxID=5861 RepID=A0A077TSY3_PLAYE|nr:YIR protein [Plasmodium yoelii]